MHAANVAQYEELMQMYGELLSPPLAAVPVSGPEAHDLEPER